MRKIEIRDSQPEDVKALKDRLRKEDAEEVLASGYANAEDALAQSFSRSTLRFTVELEGVPVAMFGIIPETILGPSANVWFLGSEAMARIKKTFVRQSRIVIAEFLSRYPVLWNIVDSRYVKTRRWLESCGAVFGTEPVTLKGVEFFGFVIRRA